MANIIKGSSERLKQMREEDSRIVQGKFTCHDPKGGTITFPYRKYREDPTKMYTLSDGQIYKLPIGVVKHLNNCGREVSSHLLDANGNPVVGIGKKDYRFNFQGLDFI